MVKVEAKETLFDGMQRREPGEVFYVADMKKVSARSMKVLDDRVSDEEAAAVAAGEEANGRKKGPSKLVPEGMRGRVPKAD